jgi:hypothetical protein
MNALPWIHVDGTRFADEDGRTVILTGMGLGGWMDMESFITGYAGVEQNMRQAMLDALGQDRYDLFFDELDVAFFDEDDARFLASLGMNSMRLPVNYRHFEDDSRPFELVERGFERLDRVVTLLARHGLYSVIDLHAVQGYQNNHWHCDNPTHLPGLWQHPHFQDRAVHLWEALAERYKDRPEVAGFNLVNEPGNPSGVELAAFYDRLVKAVRAVDPRHMLFLDGNRYATDFTVFDHMPERFGNVVYAAHDYALPGMADSTGYPGEVRGEYCDKAAVEQTFLRRTSHQRATGTPIWLGEFGPVYPLDRPQADWRYQVLQDQLDIYRQYGASWSAWTYKDIGLQGVVYADPESPYMRHTLGFRQLKERLGADSWGGTDQHIRHIIGPLEDLMATEFPEYDPYPWGQSRRIGLLVRHILLCEPMAARYAALFAGLDEDGLKDMARSFRFDACVVREQLKNVLERNLR